MVFMEKLMLTHFVLDISAWQTQRNNEGGSQRQSEKEETVSGYNYYTHTHTYIYILYNVLACKSNIQISLPHT